MAFTRPFQTTLSGIQYLAHHNAVGVLDIAPALESETPLRPALLLSTVDGRIDTVELRKDLEKFAEIDDVYSDDFLDSLIIQVPPGTVVDPEKVKKDFGYSNSAVFSQLWSSTAKSARALLPSGPYFLHGQNIHQAWRSYTDHLDAFVQTVLPNNATKPYDFAPLQAISSEGVYFTAAVPSRLYGRSCKEKPLGGMRISIKDNFALAGIKSTMMNRAYTELYDRKQASAKHVQKLMDLGAIIVGKTKMSAFASAEEPTDQWIDYHCPFNPRGDKYQSPSGSTTGGAAALAGYDWLDASIGTDTTGSIRAPATCNGVYALRSSWGSGSLEGVVNQCKAYDTVGLLSRDLSTLYHLARTSLELKEFASPPKEILYPEDFFPHSNSGQQAMVDEFVETLESHLGVKRTSFRFTERWAQCPPPEAKGKSLKDYLSKSGYYPFFYDGYHQYDQFREDYRRKFGKEPYVSPYMQFRWVNGAKVTKEERDQGLAELQVFRDWAIESVLSPDPKTGSNAILIMPSGNGGPKYRDSPNNPPSPTPTFSENYVASILQLPQLILPIGQNPYESRVSGRLEHRPIVGSLVGAKGSDLMLIKLAQEVFERAGWPTTINTGRYMFPLGDNPRNVAPVKSREEPASKLS